MAELVIGDLVLNLTGLSERDAADLGRGLARALAERLPDVQGGALSRIDLTLPSTRLTGPGLVAWLADRIAEAVA